MKHLLTLIFVITSFFVLATTTQAASIRIRARGTHCLWRYPQMQLKINGRIVKTWNVTGSWKIYSYTYNAPINALAVAFPNDCYRTRLKQDRNLYVDWVSLSGTIYQTSETATATGCKWNNPAREVLACPGEFRYNITPVGSSTATPIRISNCSCAINATPTSINEGESVSFSVTESGFTGTKTYNWNFGDCSVAPSSSCTLSGSNSSPSHTYDGNISSNQSFNVTLTIDNNGGSTTCSPITINVNALDPIRGTVWKDHNQDSRCNSADKNQGGLSGVTVKVSGPDTDTPTTDDNGNYSTKDLSINQIYTVEAIEPAGYLSVDKDNYPNPHSSVRGGSRDIDFCLSQNPPPWFQVKDADVYGGSISIEIPFNQYFMTGAQIPSSEGPIIVATNLSNTGPGKLQEGRDTVWLVTNYRNYDPPITPLSYNEFKKLYDKRIQEPDNGVIEVTPDTGTLTANNPQHANKVVFVNGNLKFESNFTGPAVFFVGGDTTITPNVETINAAIISHRDTIINAANPPRNSTLQIQGTVASLNGKVSVKREREDNRRPAVQFIYDPRYVVDFVDKLGLPRIQQWQETTP